MAQGTPPDIVRRLNPKHRDSGRLRARQGSAWRVAKVHPEESAANRPDIASGAQGSRSRRQAESLSLRKYRRRMHRTEPLTDSMDLNILSAGASKGLVESLQAKFAAETGVRIHGTFRAVGTIKEKALAGEPCDVIILTAAMIDELARFGRVLPESVAPLGRVRTAIAVREGDSLPDIQWRSFAQAVLASAAIYIPDAERATRESIS